MPITLSGLKKKLGTVTLFGEDGDENALHVQYYLVPLETWEDTIKSDAALKNADDATRLRAKANDLKDMVASWDLLDDRTKKPVPIETDAICAKVPHALIIQILQAIAEDRRSPNLSKSDGQSSVRS